MNNNNQDENTPEWKVTREDMGLPPVPTEKKENTQEEKIPEWKVTREDMGLPPVPTEKTENTQEEKTPEWKVTREDMGLVDMKDQALIISGPAYVSNNLPQPEIFGQGGTNFSQVLSQTFADMQKSNPDTPKHVLIITDGDNGDFIESLTTTTYNEEQKKKELKDIPETDFKEVNTNEPVENKIDWREALRKHFQTVEGGQKITFPEGTALDISFTGIPKAENEPISKLDPIVLYSMEPQSMGTASVEKNNTSREDLLQRIKNVNSNVGSDTKNDNDNKPKLK